MLDLITQTALLHWNVSVGLLGLALHDSSITSDQTLPDGRRGWWAWLHRCWVSHRIYTSHYIYRIYQNHICISLTSLTTLQPWSTLLHVSFTLCKRSWKETHTCQRHSKQRLHKIVCKGEKVYPVFLVSKSLKLFELRPECFQYPAMRL